ncbi:hypothetical protein [Sporichthya sp.]|uniref:hypothetical protein n=1 Tax=Sporichthya sp. TaxID=65475 RepID=UPI00183A55DE|nr:hypothetical protein [Sporichthya sp.]MBA3742112.1 hypothetical protein [Sporichthya sp.]
MKVIDARTAAYAVLCAVPGLILALAGAMHPHLLTVESAHEWWTLHVWLLPVFPLLPAALCLLLRGDDRPVAWAARLTGYAFAVGYTALDVLDGIGAGLVVDARGEPNDVVVNRMFEIGDRLGKAGIWALLGCALLTITARWTSRGAWVLVPAALVYTWGALAFREHHIFAPRGVWAMLALALGTALVALAPARGIPDQPDQAVK